MPQNSRDVRNRTQNTRRRRVSFFLLNFMSLSENAAGLKTVQALTHKPLPSIPRSKHQARSGNLFFVPLFPFICFKQVARGLLGQRPVQAGAGRPFQERRGTFLRRARETMPAPALRARRAPHRLGPGHSERCPGPSPEGVRSYPVPTRPTWALPRGIRLPGPC